MTLEEFKEASSHINSRICYSWDGCIWTMADPSYIIEQMEEYNIEYVFSELEWEETE